MAEGNTDKRIVNKRFSVCIFIQLPVQVFAAEMVQQQHACSLFAKAFFAAFFILFQLQIVHKIACGLVYVPYSEFLCSINLLF